jgi:hypothetical protein
MSARLLAPSARAALTPGLVTLYHLLQVAKHKEA